MDILASGINNKVKSDLTTLKNKLGASVTGSKATLDERLDALNTSLNGAVELTNERIKADAINILKLHDRVNALLLQSKFQKANLYFDDFIDTTGTNTAVTTASYENIYKRYQNTTSNPLIYQSASIATGSNPKTALVVFNGYNVRQGTIQISRNNGSNWYTITNESLYTFPTADPTGTNMIIKMTFTGTVYLESLGVIWTV